jgi:pimeloyl-ACP methyl ester carboxylesterase/translation elongation factor EF-1beta
MFLRLAILLAVLGAVPAFADGPKDNLVDNVRRIPPPGIKVPDKDREELALGLAALRKNIDSIAVLAANEKFRHLLPDVEIYYNAVAYALKYDEFHKEAEIKIAYDLLKQGQERAAALRKGEAPWMQATGLVVRGYRSKIDGSVQPYGLEVPKSFDPTKKHRLDFWFHGRGETLSELAFVQQRSKTPGQFQPPDTIVLHPYGRYCNANHFAGEIDALEALEHCKKFYPIDEDRIVVRGFSMGGAACWNYAVHYAWKWAAAAPGAGFSETPDFLKVFQNEVVQPTWYEKKLFHLYDCTDWAENLYHLPTIAYSGENDKQKQAADVMVAAMKREGLTLPHVIGPKTGHSYHPDSKIEINKFIDAAAAKGRNRMPDTIRFTTYTLKYRRMHWVSVENMGQHWERARVEAAIKDGAVHVKTQNVTALSLNFEKMPAASKVILDGAQVADKLALVNRFRKGKTGWQQVDSFDDGKLRKIHDLQGPIDDAFMDPFVMVAPTGKALNDKVGAWIQSEHEHAVEHWRRQFRGIAPVKRDTEITDADIASKNLVLWGDPSSNAVLRRIADKLPVAWTESGVKMAGKTYAADSHVPVLIYPNPLNPKKYVVLNSGFTFREYDYLNNARQVPKLPDWAIMDITKPRTSRHAAGIADAGFFGEEWEVTKTNP